MNIVFFDVFTAAWDGFPCKCPRGIWYAQCKCKKQHKKSIMCISQNQSVLSYIEIIIFLTYIDEASKGDCLQNKLFCSIKRRVK